MPPRYHLLSTVRAILKQFAIVIPVGVVTAALSLCLASPALARPAVLTARSTTSQINIRTAPTTSAPAPNYGVRGDRVETLGQTTGNDGYIWYKVQFRSGIVGWVRADFVRLDAATGTPAVASPTPRPAPMPTPVVTNPAPTRLYTSDQINYFLEVALGSELGAANAAIRKWSGAVKIRINGTPTSEDLRTVNTVISDVNAIAQGIRLQIDNSSPNVEIYFAPESQFSQIEPNYQPVNLGYFWTWWNQNTLNRARILISTTGVTQTERSHLIREELTQSLGLMQDSYRYRDSIFYQGWTSPTQYSAVDRALIQMLYRPEVRPGMTRSQVTSALSGIPSTAPSTASTARIVPSNSDTPLDFSLEQP